MNTVVLDTSFLAHALVPSQQTPESAEALVRLIASDDNIVIPAPLIVEFGSLVRKAANLGRVSVVEAQEIFSYVFDLKAIMDVTPGLLSRGYEIAENSASPTPSTQLAMCWQKRLAANSGLPTAALPTQPGLPACLRCAMSGSYSCTGMSV